MPSPLPVVYMQVIISSIDTQQLRTNAILEKSKSITLEHGANANP